MQLTITDIDRAPGLPASIPYKRDTAVQVDIDWQQDAPSPVSFSVLDTSNDNGIAVIVGNGDLDQSGTITLRGTAQTQAQHNGNIRLRAEWNGQQVAISPGFSVCSHPCAVWNGPDFQPHIADALSGHWVGLFVQIRVESDSNDTPDLDMVEDQEVLSEPRDRSASMQGNPVDVPTTAQPELISNTMIDRHRMLWLSLMQYVSALNGQEGYWSNDQLDVFKCPRCGMVDYFAVSHSGYRIQRRFFQSDNGRQRHSVRKFPHDVTIHFEGTNYASAAGPGEPCEITFNVEYEPPPPIDLGDHLAAMDEAMATRGRA